MPIKLLRKTIILVGALALAIVTFDRSALAAAHHGIHRAHHETSFAHMRSDHRRHRVHLARRMTFGSHRHVGLRAYGMRQLRSNRSAQLIRNYVGPSSAYAPTTSSGYTQTGRASFYSGGRTASGGNVGAATCAHRSLPFGTRVLVTNLANQRQAMLTVNDRGPFARGRVIDVSRGAAGLLGMLNAGIASVRVQVIGGRG